MEHKEGKALQEEDEALAPANKPLMKKAKIGGAAVEYESNPKGRVFTGPNSKIVRISELKLTINPEGDALHEKLGIPHYNNICHYTHYDPEKQKYMKRFHRNHDASLIRSRYKLVKGRKICVDGIIINIGRSGKLCYDSPWVAVHGLDSICMVTFRKPVDLRRLPADYHASRTEKPSLREFSAVVISEVECIPYNDRPYNRDILRELCSGKVGIPFGVASLPGEGLKKDLYLVRDFLREKMRYSFFASSHYEIVQTAIAAFQLMLRVQGLRAEDIWVTIMKVPNGRVDDLDIGTIKEQVDIVNGRIYPTKSPLKPLFVPRVPPLEII